MRLSGLMMKSMRLLMTGAMFALLLMLGGCGTQQIKGEFSVVEGNYFDFARVNEIVDGSTSDNVIVDMFGTPENREPAEYGENWNYRFVESKTDETNEFMHGIKVKTKVEHILQVTIKDGIAQKHEYRERSTKETSENRF